MKDKVSKILYDEFCNVYCNSCRNNMNWSLSKEYADEVAEKIMKELGLSTDPEKGCPNCGLWQLG